MKKQDSDFVDLPLDGWLWEIIRRDEIYKRRFTEIENAVQEYNDGCLIHPEYTRKVKSYRAHLRRYGFDVSELYCTDLKTGKSNSYLFVPLPSKTKYMVVPRPEVRYKDLEAGPARRLGRKEIRDLLIKYDLLMKKGDKTSERPQGIGPAEQQEPWAQKEAGSERSSR